MKIKDGQARSTLKRLYEMAAEKAYNDGVDPDDENRLVAWITANCEFNRDHLFFLVLGIGAELADLIATGEGFQNQVDKIWKEKISPNWECDQSGIWHRKNTAPEPCSILSKNHLTN